MTDSDLRPPRRLGPKPFTAHPRRWWDALAGSGFLIVLAATAGLAIGVPAGMRDYTPSPAKIRADKEQLDPDVVGRKLLAALVGLAGEDRAKIKEAYELNADYRLSGNRKLGERWATLSQNERDREVYNRENENTKLDARLREAFNDQRAARNQAILDDLKEGMAAFYPEKMYFLIVNYIERLERQAQLVPEVARRKDGIRTWLGDLIKPGAKDFELTAFFLPELERFYATFDRSVLALRTERWSRKESDQRLATIGNVAFDTGVAQFMDALGRADVDSMKFAFDRLAQVARVQRTKIR